MIENVSVKPQVHFKGVENNNFKGANALNQQSGVLLEGRNTREDYASTVSSVSAVHNQFTAPQGAGMKLDRLA